MPPMVRYMHFNPRPPRGGRRARLGAGRKGGRIFQSTPPARGATASTESSCQRQPISIHAPREGGDTHAGTLSRLWPYFNPRPPRGGRLHGRARRAKDILHFNPRPPRGGRPYKTFDDLRKKQISIHAPREGGDTTPPYAAKAAKISIHAPREGGDVFMAALLTSLGISIHAPREGGDDLTGCDMEVCLYFNPRPPRGGRHVTDKLARRMLKYFNPRPPRGGRRYI